MTANTGNRSGSKPPTPGPAPYVGFQSALDSTVVHGWNDYGKSTHLPELRDDLIDVIVQHAFSCSSPRSYVAMFHLKGAVSRVAAGGTAFVQEWLGQEARGQKSRPDEAAVGETVISGQAMPVLRFMGFPPNCDASGDLESMALLAGQSVGLVREIKPAGQIVRELVEEARHIISQCLGGLVFTGAGTG